MKKISMELVRDFDGTYYLNLSINGENVRGLPEYVNYRTIRAAVREKCGLIMPPLSAFNFQKFGRKEYGYLTGIA